MIGIRRASLIQRTSNQRKIVGNFGEYLVCNWLSRSGFEVCIVDHTGMDIIAYDPGTGRRLGISVKTRLRVGGTEKGSVYLFREKKEDRQKLRDACEAFGCEPWVAVYVECATVADLFLTSLRNYDSKYSPKQERAAHGWGMTTKHLRAYAVDPEVRHIGIQFKDENWSWEPVKRTRAAVLS